MLLASDLRRTTQGVLPLAAATAGAGHVFPDDSVAVGQQDDNPTPKPLHLQYDLSGWRQETDDNKEDFLVYFFNTEGAMLEIVSRHEDSVL